jgi:ADP-ribose pyrophosphatase YjhB (NUDIX family)
MPNIEIPDELWNEINAQQARLNVPTQADLLAFYLEIAQTRYWPAVGAIVMRNNAEILLVGNDYGRNELIWNLPGGAVDPGEDLIQAVSRELYEETGLTALEVGPLAWIIQAVLADKCPFIIGFAFEVTAWQGQVTVENEVDHGDVQQAKFVPFKNAVECVIEGNRTALRDWLADPYDIPRIYLSTPEGVRRLQ